MYDKTLNIKEISQGMTTCRYKRLNDNNVRRILFLFTDFNFHVWGKGKTLYPFLTKI